MAGTSSSSLIRIRRLSFIVLVDNSIEWMTKLPPGFKHEVPYHLSHGPPVDSLTGVPFVDLENYCCGAHGLSILISTQATPSSDVHHTLFDAGPDSKSLARNLAALKIDPADIERVVLSHWHADHSGGILSLLRARNESVSAGNSNTKPVVLDLHPDRPLARGISLPQRPEVVIARLPPDPTFEEIEALGGRVEKHPDEHVVAEGAVYVSGKIPRVAEFEDGLLGARRWVEGAWVEEHHLYDERYLAVDVLGKGLVIFTACSHAGAVNVIRDAVKRHNRPVHMLVGGLHLAGPELVYRIPPTIKFLSETLRPSPTYVLPMHCSGFNVKIALQEVLGNGVVPVGTGDSYEVVGTGEGDDRLWVELSDLV